MMRRMIVGGILSVAFATGCGSSRSQDRVVVTPPPRAVRHVSAPDVIVVERTHVPKGHAYGWWKQHGYREVTVYFDGTRYYSGKRDSNRFHPVTVYQRDGKYYMSDADGDDHGHGKGKGKDKDD